MQYIANVAILYKGSRVKPKSVIDLSQEDASRLGADVSPFVDGGEAEEPVVDDTPIAEMNNNQLKAKAKELGLKATGSKADLLERINLHFAGADAAADDEITN